MNSSDSEKLYLVDLDRTLVDTTRLGNMLIDVAMDMGFDVSELRSTMLDNEGNSFQLLKETLQQIGDEFESELHERFLDSAKQSIGRLYGQGGVFEPDAQRLLEFLTDKTWAVFTYGEDTLWQRWKIEAAGLGNANYIITDENDEQGKQIPKSTLLTRMQKENGEFEVACGSRQVVFYTKNIVFVDDKPMNFEDLPTGVKGYLYYPTWVEKTQADTRRQMYAKFLANNKYVIRLHGHGELVALLELSEVTKNQ